MEYKKYTHKLSIVERVERLEKRLFKGRPQREKGLPCKCDGENCKKEAQFQCGLSIDRKTGSWCSDKCFNKFKF